MSSVLKPERLIGMLLALSATCMSATLFAPTPLAQSMEMTVGGQDPVSSSVFKNVGTGSPADWIEKREVSLQNIYIHIKLCYVQRR